MDDGGEEPERAEMSAPNTWMECSIYQNYTASEVMVQGLAGVVSQVSPKAQSQISFPMLSPKDLSQFSVRHIFPNAQSHRSLPKLSSTVRFKSIVIMAGRRGGDGQGTEGDASEVREN